jgi:predicted ATP-binding protein involved in virulence
MEAVRSLFSESSELLNPETVFLRCSDTQRAEVRQTLLRLLMMEEGDGLKQSSEGLRLLGPWGDQPLDVISDGYKNTTRWILDLVGRLALANRDVAQGGILLMDEIEQHLHPRWQRYFIQRIRSAFPGFQLISTTHTPLTAGGASDVSSSQVVLLRLDDNGVAEKHQVLASEFAGMHAGQLLTSLFGLFTTRSPRTANNLERYAWLLGEERTPAVKQELADLKKELEMAWSLGENALSREVEKVVAEEVKRRFEEARQKVDPSLIDLEVRRQVHNVYSSDSSETSA